GLLHLVSLEVEVGVLEGIGVVLVLVVVILQIGLGEGLLGVGVDVVVVLGGQQRAGFQILIDAGGDVLTIHGLDVSLVGDSRGLGSALGGVDALVQVLLNVGLGVTGLHSGVIQSLVVL